MKKLTAIITGALTVLAISATAFAANLISAEEARAIAQKQVPTGSTYLHTEAELQKLQPYYEVKIFDTATQTKYEIDVFQVNGKIKEYNMERKALGGSANVILSKDDVKAIVANSSTIICILTTAFSSTFPCNSAIYSCTLAFFSNLLALTPAVSSFLQVL